MSNSLMNCGVCSKPFTHHDFPPLPQSLVFTVCFHIFHQSCLGEWVNGAPTKDCPVCRRLVYKHQAGKDYKVYWTIFLKALKHDPKIVHSILQTSDHTNSACTTCLEDFPLIPLQYDTVKKQFVHATCSSSEMPHLLMQDLANIIKEIIAKDPVLQPKFTPTPPTLLMRLSTSYPFLLRMSGFLGRISMATN